MSQHPSVPGAQFGASSPGNPALGAAPLGSSPLGSSPLAAEREGLDACVHCGFCLPACPTYLTLEDENDSPRGRLVLMRALLEGRVQPDDADLNRHLDQCLGCRGCETACPSGVPYGALLEASRATLAAHKALPWTARLLLWVFARDWALRPMLAAARVMRWIRVPQLAAAILPARLAMPAAMLAATQRPSATAWTPRGDGSRGSVALLTGCVMEGLMAPLNRATERTLAHNNYALRRAANQVCCGALHAHAGDAETARGLARRNIAAFEASGAEVVVTNSAGCGAMCRSYAHLLAGDPEWSERAAAFSAKVRDVHELLAAAGPVPTDGDPAAGESAAHALRPASTAASDFPTGKPVAWDAPCHLQHGQRVVDPPLQVLRAIAGIRVVPLEGSDLCCGSAGIYNVANPGLSERVLAPKLDSIRLSGASIVATGNPGCLMQIEGGLLRHGLPAVARHPVELLDAAYAQDDRTR